MRVSTVLACTAQEVEALHELLLDALPTHETSIRTKAGTGKQCYSLTLTLADPCVLH